MPVRTDVPWYGLPMSKPDPAETTVFRSASHVITLVPVEITVPSAVTMRWLLRSSPLGTSYQVVCVLVISMPAGMPTHMSSVTPVFVQVPQAPRSRCQLTNSCIEPGRAACDASDVSAWVASASDAAAAAPMTR